MPPISDNRVLVVPIGCGKCMECMKKKARDWQVRLLEDVRTNKNGKFVTLTFSNESYRKIARKINSNEITLKGYELDNAIAKYGVRKMLERWRKTHKKSVRHYLVTELGGNGTENVHMHGILWTNESMQEIRQKWKYGYVYPNTKEEEEENYVNEKTINYIMKYISKVDGVHKEYKPIILTSAGIGKNYVHREDAKGNKYKIGETKETYTTRTGHKIAMPIYWRNKIYTDEEREKLWIEKLDKQERWVCGERIDISEGEENYIGARNWYRAKNERLGYGGEETEESKKDYENKRREYINNIRLTE